MRHTNELNQFKCSVCKEWKSKDEFHKNKGNLEDKAYYCRSCNYIKTKAYFLKHKDKAVIYTRTWQKKHPEKHALYLARYWAKKAGLEVVVPNQA